MNLSLMNEPIKNAELLAHLASAAYLDDPTDYPDWETFGIQKWQPLAPSVRVVQGFWAMNDDNLFLVFRGTDDIRDMLFNVNVLSVQGYGGRVHRGFADILERSWPTIRQEAEKLQKEPTSDKKSGGRTLWIAGHSLGGALAVLAGQRLIAEGLATPTSMAVYTYGQPRVGDEEFSRNYPGNLCRYLHRHDIVAAVPPREILPMFSHVGDNLWLAGRNGVMTSRPNHWMPFAVRYAIKQLLGMIRNPDRSRWLKYLGGTLLVGWGIKDHGMRHYVKELELAAKR